MKQKKTISPYIIAFLFIIVFFIEVINLLAVFKEEFVYLVFNIAESS